MNIQKSIISALVSLIFLSTVFGQEKNSNDQTLRGSGRVNPSTLAMEFDLPLGSYSGRGINVPISLNYSSKVWRMQYAGVVNRVNSPSCGSLYVPWFAEDSASGWTTSLAVPYIEYTGKETTYNNLGFPIAEDVECVPAPQNPDYRRMVRRLVVHLPGGETHELRADANSTVYYLYADPQPTDVWNATFYAADGSNIKYIEDSATGTYKLLMPDGSTYNFAGSYSVLNNQNVRKAVKYTDRNGNFTEYNSNGTLTDTLGRTLSAPIGLDEPTSPTTQTYSMPGMTGEYKFVWKQLKGSSVAESGLTDFNQNLRYRGNAYHSQSPYPWAFYASGTYLFRAPIGSSGDYVTGGIFNPVVLTEIELPTGQKYKFRYSIFGLIEKVEYPTGGEEKFDYAEIPTLSLSVPTNTNDSTNLGVVDRKVLKTSNDNAPYQWTYGAKRVDPKGYKVTINNPDGTMVERFLHRGNDSVPYSPGNFGYDNGLAGMSYEERAYDSDEQMVSKKLTHWTKTSFGGADWHPRVTHEETHIYDPSNNVNKVWATAKYEYEDLSTFDKPLLRKKTSEYAYQASSGGSLVSELPGADPDPDPTPVPTPVPPTLVRTSEITYLMYDTVNYPDANIRQKYIDKNMVGLATSSVIKDSAGTIVSKSETKYDDTTNYPVISSGSATTWQAPVEPNYRGIPNTARVWDSSKGAVTNPNAYIETHAQFDNFGNQLKSWDALGNLTVTSYASPSGEDYKFAYPTQVTSAIADPSGTNGSNTAFTIYATFNWVTGLPQTTTDANGLVSHIEYDPVTLRVTKTKTSYNGSPVGSESEMIYHDEPNNYWVKSKTLIDTNKWTESITYFDGLGRAYLAEEINSEGNIFVKKEFDQDGRVLRVTNPYRSNETKVWTTNIYDEASRVKEVILPDGATVKTDYGVSVSGVIGVTKQITDQAGKKRKGISDALGRMIRVIEDPLGQNLNTDYTFDTLGNLRKTVQGEQSRYFTYDSLGRLLRAKQPEQDVNTNLALSSADAVTGHNQWSVKYEYDDNGNITKTTDARNVSITGTYDKLNRLKVRDYSDATPDVGFYYDGRGLPSIPNFSKGKMTKVSSTVSETRYTSFDVLGRLLTHEQRTTAGQIAGTETPYQTAYAYNLPGALIEETYPSGRKVKVDYDIDGDVASVWGTVGSQNRQYVNAIRYNSAGGIERMKLGNGKWETAKYNDRQQIIEIGLGNSSADQSLLKLEYGYGNNTQNNGSLRSQKISFNGLAHSFQQAYTYDDLNRVKSATETVNSSEKWKQTFNYDRYGNRTFDAGNTTTLPQYVSTKITNPQIQTSNNRIKQDQDDDLVNDYGYDLNGNLVQDAGDNQFFYDADNHQTEIKNASNQTIGLYLYDGEGRRVKKITNTETTLFIYNAMGQLVAEYSTQTAQTPQISYLTQDQLGSPRIITDQTGKVTTRKDYMAFGDETFTAERTTALKYDGQSETRKGYTGYEKDDESGLDFAQARYYNSMHGRFTSVDPLTASATIRDPQTFNRYSYVLNSPYKFIDPLGLISKDMSSLCSEGCEYTYGDESSSGNKKDLNGKPEDAFSPTSGESSLETIKAMIAKYTKGLEIRRDIISGDYYDRAGNFMATDGIKDNKIYLLNEGQKPSAFPCGMLSGEELQRLKNASSEVGGLVVMSRAEEGEDYTVSSFRTIGGVIEKDVSGYILEPGGPDTTISNQDKRVPEGVYDLHEHSGARFKDTFGISNQNVSKDRAIVIHAGNSGADTEGCLMPGGTKSSGSIGKSKTKTEQLKSFIKSEGAKNVKLIIRNEIRK